LDPQPVPRPISEAIPNHLSEVTDAHDHFTNPLVPKIEKVMFQKRLFPDFEQHFRDARREWTQSRRESAGNGLQNVQIAFGT
jgi:hypothetical protein